MKIIKSPYKHHSSIVLVIPSAIVKFLGISIESKLLIKSRKNGFDVRVKK